MNKRLFTKIILIVLWTVMAVVLALAATLICAVSTLTPERLTPIVASYARRTLNADVSLAKAEVGFRPSFPVLTVSLDSLTIVSHAFDSLPAAERRRLPAYADTLFSIESFTGRLDLLPLLRRGEIAVKDVELTAPTLNIVFAENGKANFEIYTTAADTTSSGASTMQLPPFSIERFAFVRPREIRYFNAADSTSATVLLLSDVALDGSLHPDYRLKIAGNIGGPAARTLLQLDDIAVGLDGRVRWDPQQPQMLAIEQLGVRGAFVDATIATELSFDSLLTVRSASLDVKPIAVTDMLGIVPDSLRRTYRLRQPFFTTDAAIGLSARLDRPFVLGRDSLPHAQVCTELQASKLVYGKLALSSLQLDASLIMRGDNPDSAAVDIRTFKASGPATAIDISGRLTNLLSDPDFDMCVKADMRLSRLPQMLLAKLAGTLDGRLDADVDMRGRMSMLSQERFHSLDVRGRLNGTGLYYLSSDTANMVDVDNLRMRFGSQTHLSGSEAASFTADVKVDTATMLFGGVGLSLSRLSLGAGLENMPPNADTTLIVPVGGGLKIDRLNIESITDTAGVRIRGLLGRVMLNRYKGDRHEPQLSADLELQRLSAGTVDTRFLLWGAKLHASMHRLPQAAKRRKEMRHLTDSISRRNPSLSADSVIRLAIEKRRHRPGAPHHRRVHGALNAEETEILEWGLSKGFKRFLFGWQLEGSLATVNARLFTPLFPLRNRINRLDIAFNTDSVRINSMRYRAGRSDMSMTGLVSNLKRGLTSKNVGNALKVNLVIESDTIDVNQLAAATFAGAAYAERLRKGQGSNLMSDDTDDSRLDEEIEALAGQQADTVGPLLIPANIDAKVDVRADNVVYSDLAMTDMHGQILLFRGAVNLHGLDASSDAGRVALSALYSAPRANDIKFGFGLELERFNIERFLRLVPAVDSLMPLMRDFSGIIDANIAATVDIDSAMNMELPTLDAAVRLTGDSLALINPDTYRTLGKWLRFRDRADNKIKHMNVELLVRDNVMQLFPFTFDIDRYRLGVVGSNDLALNFNYHIAVLKSPLPFKFGINISGNPDKYKVRFGGSKFKNGVVAEQINVVDTARVNLIRQIENVFRRGVDNSRFARLQIGTVPDRLEFERDDSGLSHADSLALMREGLIPAPAGADAPDQAPADGSAPQSGADGSAIFENQAVREKENEN